MSGKVLLIIVSLFFCFHPKQETQQAKANPPDTLKWIDSFKDFRTAVYKGDKTKVKQFIDFPILNDGNAIWWWVYNNDEKRWDSIPKQIKPFTEKDFEKFYSKIFSGRFINSILKIKTSEFYKTNEVKTTEFKENSDSTYWLVAVFYNDRKILSLNLFSKTIQRNNDGEISDVYDMCIVYLFDIVNGDQIKFKGLGLIG